MTADGIHRAPVRHPVKKGARTITDREMLAQIARKADERRRGRIANAAGWGLAGGSIPVAALGAWHAAQNDGDY
jgi:hypothetical protein